MDRIFGAEVAEWIREGRRAAAAFLKEAEHTAVPLQLGLVAVCLLASVPLGSVAESALEERIRRVRGNPQLLRFLALVLRRIKWIVASCLLGVALLSARSLDLGFDTGVVAIALALIVAWVTISIVSRFIRNRALGRLVAWGAWSVVALQITGLFEEFSSTLDALSVRLGTVRVSAWLVLQVVVLCSALLWLASVTGNIAERQLARSRDLTPSLQVLIGKLLKIGLVLLAGSVALAVLGIDLTALTFVAGALGLGIGFGLQKVVSNFVSGIIILLDKSIKPGDTIAVGETFGWVHSLRARYVEVITRDGREYLIPNEDFVTQRVENWSFKETTVRLDVTFGVSYDSDPHEVRRIAVEAARSIERVVATPPPVCHMTQLADSSIDFVLRFWIADPQNGVTNVRGAVLLACWDAFKAAGVAIPYPHRQIIMERPAGLGGADDSAAGPGIARD